MTVFNRFKNSRAAREVEDSWLLQSLIWILFLGLIYGLFTIALINIKPYADLLAGVGGQTKWVYNIPILGTLLERLTIGAASIGAFLIWAPVQILECLWLVIALDAKAQKAAVRESIALTNDLESQTDSKNSRHRRAVKRVSKIPFFFTKWAAALALGAYCFDLIVGLRAYPVWKDWQAFGFWIKSMNPIWLNVDNARDLGIMLFSFELMLVLTIVVGQWVFYRQREDV
jgi:hypothetical protein